MSLPLLVVAGTRPEVLKLAPVVEELRRRPARFDVRVCLSGQHGEMAREIAREVAMAVDFEPAHSERPPGLSESFADLLVRLGAVVAQVRPRGVVVQGDTNTALAAGLAAFHAGVPVFHVEAGLRTSDPSRPFPEEMNRRLLARLAVLHFAPTEGARTNLLAEGVASDAIVVTGNTVIDALSLFGAGHVSDGTLDVATPRKLVLVTLHRRESEGSAKGVVDAARTLADRADTQVVWVRHPNATGRAASEGLSHAPRVRVIDPQPYGAFVTLLRRARVVLSDSGGVQEEACALGVPVVVLRAETDRPEAVRAGNAVVVGTEAAAVAAAATAVLEAEPEGRDVGNPFGDGRAAARIADGIEAFFDGAKA